MWESLGPSQVTGQPGKLAWGGLIDSIALSSDFDGFGTYAMFIASSNASDNVRLSGGGVWRAVDYVSSAPTWQPLTDHLPDIPDTSRPGINDIRTIAVDPNNPQVIYAGAGGAGTPAVLVSPDGGGTWSVTGKEFASSGGVPMRIVVDPASTVYAALLSGGLWEFKNSDNSWVSITPAALSAAEFHDVVVANPGDTGLYVGIVDRSNPQQSGIWHFDAGTWTQMPMVLADLRGEAFAPSVINRITMASDPSAGACASLSQAEDDARKVDLLNLFTLGGELLPGGPATWLPQWFSQTDWFITQSGYTQGVGIAPDGRLYGGGRGLAQSAGGTSFVAIGTDSQGATIHTDQHCVFFTGGQVYVGTDGGLFRGTPMPGQPGIPAWESLNTASLATFLSLTATAYAGNPSEPLSVITASQDNGISRIAGPGWTRADVSSEREIVRYDPSSSGSVAYSASPQYGFCRSLDGGATFTQAGPRKLNAPYAVAPSTGWVLTTSGPSVFLSADQGTTWNQVLTLPAPPDALTYAGGYRAYISASDLLFRSDDGGATWAAPVGLQFGEPVVSLAADPANADNLFALTPSRVLVSTDGQGFWQDMTGDLPALGFNALAAYPATLGGPIAFVATNVGVYATTAINGSATAWTAFDSGLPDADVTDIECGYSHLGRVVVAAFGRGAWATRIPFLTEVAPASAGRVGSDGQGYLFVVARSGTGDIWLNQAAQGGAFVGWQPVPGGVTTDVPVAAGMQGETLFVFAKTPGMESEILFNQAAEGGPFDGWLLLPGMATDAAPAAAGRLGSDGQGYLFVFAKTPGPDGEIWFNQAEQGGAFVGWQPMPGGVTTDVPVAAGMQGETLFVFAKTPGPDGEILFNQAAEGGAFVGWQTL